MDSDSWIRGDGNGPASKVLIGPGLRIGRCGFAAGYHSLDRRAPSALRRVADEGRDIARQIGRNPVELDVDLAGTGEDAEGTAPGARPAEAGEALAVVLVGSGAGYERFDLGDRATAMAALRSRSAASAAWTSAMAASYAGVSSRRPTLAGDLGGRDGRRRQVVSWGSRRVRAS